MNEYIITLELYDGREREIITWADNMIQAEEKAFNFFDTDIKSIKSIKLMAWD